MRLYALHESTLTSTCGGTQAINNRQSHEGTWKGSRHQYKQFRNPEKVSEQIDCLIFDPCEVICLIISLFNSFLALPILSFTLLLSCIVSM